MTYFMLIFVTMGGQTWPEITDTYTDSYNECVEIQSARVQHMLAVYPDAIIQGQCIGVGQ